MQDEKFLSKIEVEEKTRLSRSTIVRLENKGEFPARRRVSDRKVFWLESEVVAWIESRGKVGG